VVETKAGTSVDFAINPLIFEGTLSIHELKDPTSGQLRAVFRMTDAQAVLAKAAFGH
jgi:hypothetical protein